MGLLYAEHLEIHDKVKEVQSRSACTYLESRYESGIDDRRLLSDDNDRNCEEERVVNAG